MKRLIKLIIICILFMPFVVNAETCETEKVNITSIDIVNQDNNKVIEVSPPTIEGKQINVDLSLSEVGTEAVYKITVENDSEEDYDFDKTSLNIDSDYISYSFDSEDNSTIIKSNSSKTLLLRVKYKKEVPEDKFENGEFNDTNLMDINLSNEIIRNNPNTGVSILICFALLVLVFSLIIFILSGKKKYGTAMVIAIVSILIIPMTAYATCRCQLKLNSKVKIVKIFNYKVDYVNCSYETTEYFPYEYGMTWRDYFESDYYLNNNSPRKITPDYFGARKWFFKGEYTCEDILDPSCRTRVSDLDELISPSFMNYYQLGDYIC